MLLEDAKREKKYSIQKLLKLKVVLLNNSSIQKKIKVNIIKSGGHAFARSLIQYIDFKANSKV